MMVAFLTLFAGGMMLGGAWSFYRSKKPWWAIAALVFVGLFCFAISIWRIQTS